MVLGVRESIFFQTGFLSFDLLAEQSKIMRGAGSDNNRRLIFFSFQEIFEYQMKMRVHSQYYTLSPVYQIMMTAIIGGGNDKFCHFYFIEGCMNYCRRYWMIKSRVIIEKIENGVKGGNELNKTHSQRGFI
jgi:hypothetical protein